MEVGVGGEYDSTNIIPTPTCTGVTSLGIDHVSVLGDTLESIAWHKGGIFKKDVAALTVEQPTGALEVLRQRAVEKEVSKFPTDLIIGHFPCCSCSFSREGSETGDSWTSSTE
jgi:folylpolyglutamate synthase